LLNIKVHQLAKEGKKISQEDETNLLKEIQSNYDRQSEPLYAAARLWVDGIMDPREIRNYISMAIELANHAPITKSFSTGVIQT
jgi:3-methylcrotonyl-CoA carboxylase beta subunit